MLEVNLSKSGKSVVISEKTYDHGVAVSQKIAALSLDPKFQELEEDERNIAIAESLAWVRTQNWELFGAPNKDGFCSIRKAEPEEEEA